MSEEVLVDAQPAPGTDAVGAEVVAPAAETPAPVVEATVSAPEVIVPDVAPVSPSFTNEVVTLDGEEFVKVTTASGVVLVRL